MRIFHRQVFDAYVNGTANVYSDPTLATLLGSVDQLAIGGFTAQVSGTSPTLWPLPIVICNGDDRGYPCRERCMRRGIFTCEAYRGAPYPGPKGVGILSACDEEGPKEFCTYDYENGWVCTFGGPIPVCIPPIFKDDPPKPNWLTSSS